LKRDPFASLHGRDHGRVKRFRAPVAERRNGTGEGRLPLVLEDTALDLEPVLVMRSETGRDAMESPLTETQQRACRCAMQSTRP